MKLTHATLQNVSVPDQPEIEVMFNPTEYSIARNMSYAEIAVPGLSMPLLQFVRGEAQTLSMELFLDSTNTREDLAGDLASLRTFVEIDSELHAPPVCEFKWGEKRTVFRGVVTGYTEKFTLFGEDGRVLRARVTLSFKSYIPAEIQYRELNRQSPDRTKTRVVHEGERLDGIAAQEYGDPRLWTVIASANNIERPRLLTPGQVLQIPPL